MIVYSFLSIDRVNSLISHDFSIPTTSDWPNRPEVSKVIRKYNARIVEVNAVFAIVEKNGMSEEITNLYEELRQLDCVLQFVRSGRVAITTSCFERVNEYLADREAKYRQSKH